jgi:hypothetical protein
MSVNDGLQAAFNVPFLVKGFKPSRDRRITLCGERGDPRFHLSLYPPVDRWCRV